MIVKELVPLRVLLLMHHHLHDLLFIKGLLPLFPFLEVLEVFKLLMIIQFTPHAVGHGKLLLLFDPIPVVVFRVSTVA